MSQFDKISFASQIFWFCSFFLISYFLFLRFILSRIYVILKVREKTLVQLEQEVKHIDNITKVWSGIVNFGLYKSVFAVILDFLNVFVSRRQLYVELSKALMEKHIVSSFLMTNTITDVLARQRIVNSLGEKKE